MIILDEKEVILNQILQGLSSDLDYQLEIHIKDIVRKVLEPYEISIKENTSLANINETNDSLLSMFALKRKGRLSDKTIKQYINAVKRLLKFYNKSLLVLTKDEIELFLASYIEQTNCSPATLNINKNYISAFYLWLKKEGFITQNPCENIENYKTVKKPVEFLNAIEWDTLKTGCRHTRDRALLEFLRSTAMRIGEVPNVKINDVNWNTGEITIFGSKTQKYRTVFLDSIALNYLELYLKERNILNSSNDFLFVKLRKNKEGKYEQCSEAGLYKSIKVIAQHSGLEKNVYPHLLRKTTATNIIKRGGTEAEAGLYLGHTPVSVTGKHYIGDTKDEIEKIFKQNVATI